ncbi:hypothetical protein GTQ40_16255 [Flavobacteriaceae bacterium R38]|nr:hypothetical protein [Flavobacteriaceae bacterium R38]
MTVTVIRLLVDFGLLILIWMIQLVVYPGFSYYSRKWLIIWHRKYTALIGYIVGPLMLAQLGFYSYQLINSITLLHVISLSMVGIIWLITFLQFVPAHKNISKGRIRGNILKSLVYKNWSRTILWTLLFILNFANFLMTT